MKLKQSKKTSKNIMHALKAQSKHAAQQQLKAATPAAEEQMQSHQSKLTSFGYASTESQPVIMPALQQFQ
jgi:Holliday junction resolvasome RuvABC DNA-binding subunit